MAIQYSGLTVYNTTFTTTTGTQQEVVNGIAAAFLAAGWAQVVGSVGAADQTFKSATTPQGYAIRIRVYNPGTGISAQLMLQGGTGTPAQTTNPIWLLPTAGGTWRFIGNAYQFFVFVPGPPSGARFFAAGGVPYVPSFLSPTAIGWLQGSGQSDTDTTQRGCLRNSLAGNNGTFNNGANGGSIALLLGGTLWSAVNNNSPNNGQIILWNLQPGWWGNQTTTQPYRFGDNSIPISDALVSWGATGINDEGQIRGQLWDACVIGDAFTADTPATFDSHNWFCITHNNSGNIYGATQSTRGSLFVVVP